MVEWGDQVPDDISILLKPECFRPWAMPVLKTKGLKRSNQTIRNVEDYPETAQREIEDALPYYEKLYALRYVAEDAVIKM
jgi:hypothetical protein